MALACVRGSRYDLEIAPPDDVRRLGFYADHRHRPVVLFQTQGGIRPISNSTWSSINHHWAGADRDVLPGRPGDPNRGVLVPDSVHDDSGAA